MHGSTIGGCKCTVHCDIGWGWTGRRSPRAVQTLRRGTTGLQQACLVVAGSLGHRFGFHTLTAASRDHGAEEDEGQEGAEDDDEREISRN